MALITPLTPADASTNSGLSSSAQKAASIDELKATDSQLLTAINTLNSEVAAQSAQVDSAKQAVDAANQAIATVQAEMAQTQQDLSVLQQAESQRAIELYMSPSSDDFISSILSSNGAADAANRAALVTALSGNTYDALDKLQATQRSFKDQQKAAFEAQKTANERQAAEKAKLDSLNAALADQNKVEGALKARIAADNAEDATSAKANATSDSGRASRGSDTSSGDTSRQSSEGLIWPVNGSHQINSPYGQRWGRMHEGIDIYATAGQAIYAAKAGTVTFAGQESGYGGYVCIQHGGGFQTCYAHEVKLMVSAGQQVTQGQELGTAGATGDSTGVNLHFETCSSTGKECFYGTFHNPVDYLP